MKSLFYFLILSSLIVSCQKPEEEEEETVVTEETPEVAVQEVKETLPEPLANTQDTEQTTPTFREPAVNVPPLTEHEEKIKLPFNQIIGVFNQEIDAHWDIWNFWRTGVPTQIVIAYSEPSRTLMVRARSTDPKVSGGFCSLMSNFTLLDKESSSNQVLTTYKAGFSMTLDDQRNPIADVYSVSKKIKILEYRDKLESVSLYIMDEDAKKTKEITLSLDERESIDIDSETFFYNWKNTSPCH